MERRGNEPERIKHKNIANYETDPDNR